MAFTARFCPAALSLILLAGIRQIEFGGIADFIHALCKKSPLDIQAMSDPQVARVMKDGVKFAIA